MRILSISFVVIALAVLHGCGLKGPLYLPEPAQAVEPQARTEAASATGSEVSEAAAENSATANPGSEDEEAEKKKSTLPPPDTTP